MFFSDKKNAIFHLQSFRTKQTYKIYIALLLSVISVSAFGLVSSFGLSPYCKANMCPFYTQCVGGHCVPTSAKPPVQKSLQTFQSCDAKTSCPKGEHCLKNRCSKFECEHDCDCQIKISFIHVIPFCFNGKCE